MRERKQRDSRERGRERVPASESMRKGPNNTERARIKELFEGNPTHCARKQSSDID